MNKDIIETSIDSDFEMMGWHDSLIYAFSLGNNFEFILDIDYIFKWVQTGKTFKFWVSPCTLVFENVYDVEFQMDGISGGIDIDEISRDNPQKPKNADFVKVDTEFDWTIETQQGSIFLKSIGYKQYVRQIPKLINGQCFKLKERGGISFDTNCK